MKTKVFLSSLLLGFLVGGYPTVGLTQTARPVQLSQSQWQPFSDRQGGFTVLMPGTPASKKQTHNSPLGAIDIYSFTTSLDEGNVTYLVTYSDFPSAVVDLPPELLLDSIRSGFAADRKIKLLNQQDISLGSYPGKEFKLEVSEKVAITHRAYLVKQRLYQVVAQTPVEKGSTLSADIEKFLSSFKLL
jgi:hypothetical protein